MAYSGASSPHLSSVPDLSHYPYYETSAESSPSPRMAHTTSSPAQISYNSFSSPPHHHNMALQNSVYTPTSPQQQQQHMTETQYLLQQHAQHQAALLSSSVEFTDLTAPVHEDRRRSRKGSTATMLDKQAISNMRIRRRAQNRASQRAFRERKEKHVQALETQLSALEDRHRDLQASHEQMGDKNERLVCEVEGLREEIRGAGGAGGGMNDFDAAVFGEDELLESDFPF
ncbi:MAG: hypothetical protein L6R37_000978 [Teloschistes peruensis]|nr:MAG: hypothetical protein L6R37_000978 [Teloschistes peruensis]